MSGTMGQAAREQSDAVAAERVPQRQGRQGRGTTTAVSVGVLVALGAGAGGAWYAGVFSSHGSAGNSGSGTAAPATQVVQRGQLESQTPVNATLGYAGSYTVSGKGSGTLTWLPSPGTVIHQGQALYRVDNGTPIVLLYGSVPAWRDMSEGTTGNDVSQLNHDLVSLGYANSSDISALGWDYYSWETSAAVQKMEEDLGVTNPPGSLSRGSVVFEPEALLVTALQASLGDPAGGPILRATSDRHTVSIGLPASQESEVRTGEAVSVTLPDGSSTPGVISAVGTVASGSGTSATIPVSVRLTQPNAAGTLDEAPVTVEITTASVRNALIVPVDALLAQSGGGYAVEVVDADNGRHLVPVTVGIFDDADGLVQVTGALTPGQRVVVPAS